MIETRRAPVAAGVLAAAAAVAFADSSIVVLALPDLYQRLHTSIVGVSWVISAYNLVVAVGAFALLRRRGPRPRAAGLWGLGLFALASVGCGLAWSLPSLLAFRCLQGLGAALLLAAALPILTSLAGNVERGTAIWASAGAVGVALGPALGGLLTELFDWRAIFLAQAPVAALGALAVLRAPDASPLAVTLPGRRGALGANVALVLVFGALVGALFLAVLLVVPIWGYSPIAGAGIVSALPLAALAVRRASRLAGARAVAGGAVLLAAGLVALALLPAASPAYAVPALALCGAGFGLAVPPLTGASVRGGEPARAAAISVGARHIGLVLALVAIAPILATSLDEGGHRAATNATAAILDARVPLTTKVPAALRLRDAFQRAQRGEVPQIDQVLGQGGGGSERRLRDALLAAIRAPLTRSFRPGFALAALLALLAAVPALALRGRRS